MSSGDGGAGVGGFLAFCFFCYTSSFLGIPIGLALLGGALMWGWYLFLFILGVGTTVAALAVVAKGAVEMRDYWLMFDLVVAPSVTIWPAIICREQVRDYYVAAYNAGWGVPLSAFLFFFLLFGIPLGILGMVAPYLLLYEKGEEEAPLGLLGTVIRLFTSYLPLFLCYASWVAIILNSISPKK